VPGTIEAILLLLLLVLPGAMCLWLVSSSVPAVLSGQRQFLVFTVLIGVLIHAICSWLTVSWWEQIIGSIRSFGTASTSAEIQIPLVVVIWAAVLFLFVPALLAWGARRILIWEKAQGFLDQFGKSKVQLTAQAWDWFFLTQTQGCWVVAEMDDNKLVGGPYGNASFASLSPDPRDLFLEEAYEVALAQGDDVVEAENARDDDTTMTLHRFGQKLEGNVGVWINGDKFRALYFYRATGES